MFRYILLLALSACCSHKNIEVKRYDTEFMKELENEVHNKGCVKCLQVYEDYVVLRSQVNECKTNHGGL